MASLFDVLDKLQEIVVRATARTGPRPACGRIVDVGQGWPLPGDVDAAMAAKPPRTIVSVYAVPGTTSDPGQVMNWDVQVVTPPVHGMTAEVTGDGLALSGRPNVGEYITVILDGEKAYTYTTAPGDLVETVAAELQVQIDADYPGSLRTEATLAIPVFHDLVVRIGAPGIIGEQLHRQKQQFRIVTWAPTPADRAAVANAIDIALKRSLKVILPDTSMALITYQSINLDDLYENAGAYRADLIFAVQWDSYAIDEAFEITVVNATTLDPALPVTFYR